MDYPRQLFRSPGPYGSGDKSYEVAGAEDEEREALLLDNGWHLSKEEAWGLPQLDHDDNGKAGGSKSAKGDPEKLKAARKEYERVMKKKPFNGWDEAELNRRIAEKGA